MGYLLVSDRKTSQHANCYPVTSLISFTGDVGMRLLRLSSSGVIGTEILAWSSIAH